MIKLINGRGQLGEALKNKTHFDSNYLNHDIQTLLINSIEKIDVYEGNLQDSDICFIKKK